MTRYMAILNGAEGVGRPLPSTSAVLGGLLAQEIIKVTFELRRVDGCRARQLAKCLQIFGGLVVGCTETIWTKI